MSEPCHVPSQWVDPFAFRNSKPLDVPFGLGLLQRKASVAAEHVMRRPISSKLSPSRRGDGAAEVCSIRALPGDALYDRFALPG